MVLSLKRIFSFKKARETDKYYESQKVYAQDVYRWAEGKELDTSNMNKEEVEKIIATYRDKAMAKFK